MSTPEDPWYVRLPNGQTARASDLESLRYHLYEGTISPESWVRRHGTRDWVPITAVVPLEESTRPSSGSGTGLAARLEGLPLRTLGVRGIGLELLAALDHTLVPVKILLGCGFAIVALFLNWLIHQSAIVLNVDQTVGPRLLIILVDTFVIALGVALLIRITHQELSEMRVVSWHESLPGIGLPFLRVAFASLIVPGLALVWLVSQPYLIAWVGTISLNEIRSLIQVLFVFLAVGLWFLMGVSLLIAPVLLIEGCTIRRAFADWSKLLRDHWGHIVLYEAVAMTLGVVASLPHWLPVGLALYVGIMPGDALGEVATTILLGFSVGPFLSYLAVANVFIYLNLRYEQSDG